MTDAGNRTVGNYVLGALIGRGGMSEVYAAEHQFLGDPVAVKLIREELALDDTAVRSFLAEAERTREIAHPNVIRVIDFGRDEGSRRCYLVMERIEGGNLAARLRTDTRIAEAELRALGAEIADGMQAAHARGTVHRDLKPGNVMLRGSHPTIVDFGIAKSLGNTSAVVTSRRIGTLAYMAPEQITGGLISAAVDIWALGIVLFEAATGQLPFTDFAEGRCPQLFDPAPRASSIVPVSAAFDAVIARCLEREPGRRYGSMAELAAALRGAPGEERITEDAGVLTLPSAPKGSATAARASATRLAWVLAIAAALATGAIGVVATTCDGAPRAPAPSTRVAFPDPSMPQTRNPPSPNPSTPQTPSPPSLNPSTQPSPTTPPDPNALPASSSPPDPRTPPPAVQPPAVPLPTVPTPGVSPPPTPAVPTAKRRNTIEIALTSAPSGATIEINGTSRGVTPARLSVAVRTRITVRHPGYRTARVVAERAGTLQIRLIRRSTPPRSGETLD